MRIYNIHIPDSEIDFHWQKTGMVDEKFCKRYLQLHYTMDLNNNGDAPERNVKNKFNEKNS